MKKEWTYIPIKEVLFSFDLGYYCSFGIEVFEEGVLCMKISDVSPDECMVSTLASLCTSEQLEPIHLYDVIEDFLNG